MQLARRHFLLYQRSAILVQRFTRGHLQRSRYQLQRLACLAIQRYWRSWTRMRADRESYLVARGAVVQIQNWWRARRARNNFLNMCRAAILLQSCARGFLARRLATRRREALTDLQRRWRGYLTMRRERATYLLICRAVLHLQTAGRGFLAREHHRRLLQDAEYREEMRRQAAAKDVIRRQEAAVVLVMAVRIYLIRRRGAKRIWASTVIQKFWRGYRFRTEMWDKWRGLTQRLEEIRGRLSVANAAAKPEDRYC